MADEIERKFLVAALPDPEVLGAGTKLRQGYLAIDGPVEVRVRRAGDAARLTVKAGSGLSRTEVEVDVDDAAPDLWPFTEGRRLEKVRHKVDLGGGAIAEVDVYEGALAGVCTVEVEFASEASSSAFRPPVWFGEELTGRAEWSNVPLACRGRP